MPLLDEIYAEPGELSPVEVVAFGARVVENVGHRALAAVPWPIGALEERAIRPELARLPAPYRYAWARREAFYRAGIR
jgi:hypothetical protein